MAFSITTFAPIGGQSSRGKAPQVYSYITADPINTVTAAGYFNSVSDKLAVGDFILAFTDTGTTGAGYVISVNANASGVVDVTDGLAVGTTDTY